MIKKITILIGVMLISIIGVYAGTFSESAGVPTWDGSLMCVAGLTQTYDFMGSTFKNISKFNNVYYLNNGTSSDITAIIDSDRKIILEGSFIIDETIDINGKQNLIIDSSNARFKLTNGITVYNISNSEDLEFTGGIYAKSLNNNYNQTIYLIETTSVDEIIKNIIIHKNTFYNCSYTFKIATPYEGSVVENININENNFYKINRALDINQYKTANGSARNIYIKNNYFKRYEEQPTVSDGLKTRGIEIGTALNSNENNTYNIDIIGNKFLNYWSWNDMSIISVFTDSNVNTLTIDNNYFENIIAFGNEDVNVITTKNTDKVFIRDNYCKNIGTDSEIKENHCISVTGNNAYNYGEGAIITGNYVENVYTGLDYTTYSGESNSEGIYCKNHYCDISNNILLDGGDTRSIVTKGDFGSTSSKIEGNIVIYKNRQPVNSGISSTQDNSTIIGNIFENLENAPPLYLERREGYDYIVKNNVGNQIDFDSVLHIASADSILGYLELSGNSFDGLVTNYINSSDTGRLTLSMYRDNYINNIEEENIFNGDVTISPNQLFKLQANTTLLTCDITNAGVIYYNGNDFKHYGCNSTTWNALY